MYNLSFIPTAIAPELVRDEEPIETSDGVVAQPLTNESLPVSESNELHNLVEVMFAPETRDFKKLPDLVDGSCSVCGWDGANRAPVHHLVTATTRLRRPRGWCVQCGDNEVLWDRNRFAA